jgi:hypothetical protein
MDVFYRFEMILSSSSLFGTTILKDIIKVTDPRDFFEMILTILKDIIKVTDPRDFFEMILIISLWNHHPKRYHQGYGSKGFDHEIKYI